MSYQMRRYLVEPDHAVDSAPVETRFLPQEVHITSKTSMQVNKSKPSYKSVQSWGDDASFYSWELDPVTGTGAWIDQDGDVYCRDEYPMTMSGVSDCVFDE
jgi:hypothetical protein